MPRLINLDVEFVSLVDRAAVRDPADPSQPQRFLLTKGEIPVFKRADADPKGGTMTTEETAAALAKAEQDRDAAIAKAAQLEQDLAKATKAAEKPEEKPAINKADLEPAVREMLEKAEAEQALAKAETEKLRKEAQDAGDIAKAERDTRITREFIAKAQEIPHVAGDADAFGPVLKAASEKLSKDEFEALNTRLAAADAQIAKGNLFKQFGADGDAPADSVTAEVTRKAAELRKADASLSPAHAMDRVLSTDPALQARYLAEMQAN